AVEGRPHGAILVGDRLGSTGHVDDGEPPHAERNVAVDIEPFAIGAPMSERGRHRPDAFQIAVAACGLEQPRNAAHQLPSASGVLAYTKGLKITKPTRGRSVQGPPA